MFTLKITLFLLCCAAAVVLAEKDTFARVQIPAVGGQVPFVVSLRVKGQHYCSGAIVSSQWIVTAARCVHGGRADWIIAYIGARSRKDGRAFGIDRIVTHPKYNGETANNDIGLVHTNQRIPFSSLYRAINLPKTDLSQQADVLISGWGFIRVSSWGSL